MKFSLTLLLFFCLAISFAQDSTKTYRFTFRAGAATGLNIYEPEVQDNIKEYSYNKVSFGTGLGTELACQATKFLDVDVHYYFYVYKNNVDFPDALIPVTDFNLKQQSHMIAFSADFKLYKTNKTKISMGVGPGFALNKEQYILADATTNELLAIGERQNVKFIAPLYIGMETYVKGYIVLGVRAQTFFWGDQHPVRTLNLFSYLGMRF